MKFELKKPCSNCPFLRVGGVRLTQGRVREIAGVMLNSQGGTFACHKTTTLEANGEGQEDNVATLDSQHCVGALIFAEKHGVANQAMRIAERLGLYKASELMADKETVDSVFSTLKQMLKENAKVMKR